MRALFIQHDPAAQPGLVGEHLRRRGFDLEVLPIGRSISDGTYLGPYPAAREFDLVVPLGAIWSLYDQQTVGTWIERELELLREADRDGVPVLGICFGGQALAAAHGGTVRAAPRPEIGFGSLDTDDPQLVPSGPWMQWHSDVFTVPTGGVEVARNAVGPQAFRLRRNLGLQFHPEVDSRILASWLELGGEGAAADLRRATGGDLEALVTDADRHLARCRRDVATLVDAFLARVAGLPVDVGSSVD
ncbi:type 1 glutamine amidotransferase [Egicoccus halophilus]|uniref:Glutamine amidotransferase n=1 Tax=Egicoccus halophilus TaxID=1670830 RepID=A0A8J3AB60_9ACTN|nr:gamma-glutamyl-gamma-aminobutyrate hydrolase family protein [Egicoccus halophilus]GGI09323.1 glutamine amidotransferase [Egicoccus halophilus]